MGSPFTIEEKISRTHGTRSAQNSSDICRGTGPRCRRPRLGPELSRPTASTVAPNNRPPGEMSQAQLCYGVWQGLVQSSPAEAIKPLDPDDLVHVRSRLIISAAVVERLWTSEPSGPYELAKDMAPPRCLLVPGKR